MIEYSVGGYCGALPLLCKCYGSVIPKCAVQAVPSACLALFLHYQQDALFWDETLAGNSFTPSQLWAACTATIIFLLSFRTNKAYHRFWDGTTLLHQMWGEWFDAASCLISFSSLAADRQAVDDFRHTLIRLMSLCHASALEEIAECGNSFESDEGYPVLDIAGLDHFTLSYLRRCRTDENLNFNRVEVIIHMIQMLVVCGQETGVLRIAPPILSRCFQTISRGQVNLANCKKITSTLFPFPYAQLITFLIIFFQLFTPMVMNCLSEKAHWAFLFTFIPVFGVFALNAVSKQLEMPFGTDANDLPLDTFQDHMNNSLLMLIRSEADHVPFPNPDGCVRNYHDLLKGISTTRVRAADNQRHMVKTVFVGPEPVDDNTKSLSTKLKKKTMSFETSSELNAAANVPAVSRKEYGGSPMGSRLSKMSEESKMSQPMQVSPPFAPLPPTPTSSSLPAAAAGASGDAVLPDSADALRAALEGLPSNIEELSVKFKGLMANVDALAKAVEAVAAVFVHQSLLVRGMRDHERPPSDVRLPSMLDQTSARGFDELELRKAPPLRVPQGSLGCCSSR